MANRDGAVPTIAEIEHGGDQRRLRGWQARLFFVLCVCFTAFHLAVLNIYPIDSILFRAIHLGWGATLGFGLVCVVPRRGVDRVPVYDWALILASIGCAAYIAINLDELQFRAGALYEPGDVVTGLVGTLLVLEFARRTAGTALALVSLVFLLYAFVGPWLPGVLYHRGYDFGFVFSYIYSDQGIFGATLEVSSTFIVLFVAFGAFLERSKAGDWFNDLSVAMVGWARGGPAKATVVSGILFGTISGSSVANVVASGSITIPMMRRTGYDRATAGAVEATSSTGGQITPPVMGAGAFLMAEITGIPYASIAYAAIFPCLLFYLACYIHCDLHAVRSGIRGLPRSELPPLAPLLKKAYLAAPLVVLVWAFVEGYSGFRAGSLGILTAIVCSWLSHESRMGPLAVAEALEKGARDTIQLVAVCAAAGIVVGVIALTGVGGRFAHVVLQVAGQHKALALIFTMLIVVLLGMGMPTTAAYAVAASVVAPGLVRLGIEPIVAHMFIFYFAVLSAITPPVAVASFAAAAIAQADPWRTSWIAIKLGLATFIVPFMFFYSSALLGQGAWTEVVQVTATAALGIWMLAAATEGWLNGPTPPAVRAICFIAALCLIVPEAATDLIGLGLGAAAFIFQRIRHGSDPGAKVPLAAIGTV
ncbi:MAG: TRAP transporter permease [Alphaproteobacteria bacterium]|nr:TRAP transporter permease [Alphaproteobacteria bacterium]